MGSCYLHHAKLDSFRGSESPAIKPHVAVICSALGFGVACEAEKVGCVHPNIDPCSAWDALEDGEKGQKPCSQNCLFIFFKGAVLSVNKFAGFIEGAPAPSSNR